MPLATKTHNDSFRFVHELKQEMHADLKYVESLEKEIDELESDKAEFTNMYDVVLQECVFKDVMCSYLLSLSDLDAPDELQCLYLHKVKQCVYLAQKLSNQTESVSKEVHSELLKRFAKVEKHSISLEIDLQKRKEQVKNDTVWNEKASNVFRKEHEHYVEIQDLKAQLQDKNIAISELKKLIERCQGKSVDTKFDKPYTKSVPKTNVSEGLSKPVTAHTLPQTARQAGLLRRRPQSQSLLRFSICDADLEVAFQKSTCFVRDLQGNDLLTGMVTASKAFSSQLRLHQPSFKEGCRDWSTKVKNFFIYLLLGFHMILCVMEMMTLTCGIKSQGSNQQDKQPSTNIQPTSAPFTPTYVHAEENSNDQVEGEHLPDDEFTNPLYANVPSQQELDLLFGPAYNEFFNVGSNQQDKQPSMNIQPTSAPFTPTYVHAEENSNDQAEGEHLPDDEFTNPLCALTQDVAESSSPNI
nr:hypothetical protein [Tanacetum cinerariifolium]